MDGRRLARYPRLFSGSSWPVGDEIPVWTFGDAYSSILPREWHKLRRRISGTEEGLVSTGAFADNLFAVLTLIVAPAVLTNATSVLTLNTSNRFACVVDR